MGIKIDLDAIGGKYPCRFPRENIAFVAAVVGDGGAWGLILGQQISGKALRCLSDGVDVHTVGAGTQLTAQPAGAEFQRAVKTLMHLFFLIAD